LQWRGFFSLNKKEIKISILAIKGKSLRNKNLMESKKIYCPLRQFHLLNFILYFTISDLSTVVSLFSLYEEESKRREISMKNPFNRANNKLFLCRICKKKMLIGIIPPVRIDKTFVFKLFFLDNWFRQRSNIL